MLVCPGVATRRRYQGQRDKALPGGSLRDLPCSAAPRSENTTRSHVRIPPTRTVVGAQDPARQGEAERSRTCATGWRSCRTPCSRPTSATRSSRTSSAAVSEKALGERVLSSLDPSQQVVGIVHQELVNLMGPVDHSLHLQPRRHRADALRPARLGQDDHLRQARPADQRARPQADARGRRLAAARGHRTIARHRPAARAAGLQPSRAPKTRWPSARTRSSTPSSRAPAS